MAKTLPPHNPREVNKRFFKPLRRLVKMNYFRLKIRGANHIPTDGQMLFVANHSGWIAIDALFMMMAIHDTAGPEYLPYILVHDMLLKVPLVNELLRDLGSIPAHWLHYGKEPLAPEINPIAIFPEGADGNSKPFWKAYHMQDWKSGFVRLAIQRRAKVVPVIIVGGEESVPVARTLDAFKPLLGSVAPLPVSLMPLPSRWKIQFLEPLDFSGYDPNLIHSREACVEIAAEVHKLVQARLQKAAKNHPLLWLSNWIDRDEDSEAEQAAGQAAEQQAAKATGALPEPLTQPPVSPEIQERIVEVAPKRPKKRRATGNFGLSTEDQVD